MIYKYKGCVIGLNVSVSNMFSNKTVYCKIIKYSFLWKNSSSINTLFQSVDYEYATHHDTYLTGSETISRTTFVPICGLQIYNISWYLYIWMKVNCMNNICSNSWTTSLQHYSLPIYLDESQLRKHYLPQSGDLKSAKFHGAYLSGWKNISWIIFVPICRSFCNTSRCLSIWIKWYFMNNICSNLQITLQHFTVLIYLDERRFLE